jgi:ribulose-phosphate 3-epimerase
VSLWSADQLALGEAVAALDSHVEGFHLDVMDGHFAPELLYGPEAVAALARRRPQALIDVHLIVDDADRWIEPFAAAGAEMLTVFPEACSDVRQTLAAIERRGVRAGLALGLETPLGPALEHLDNVDRILVMGTAIGIKGVEPSPAVYERVSLLRDARERSRRAPEIVVDGGIRRHTVPELARAGADGVVPGSLVFGARDWLEGVRFVHAHDGRGDDAL